jgi:hypothetical protein
MKLHDKQFYSGEVNMGGYHDAQIKRHVAKMSKKRKAEHYLKCADKIIGLVQKDSNMICMGTRNNHERDVLKDGLLAKNIKVHSLDISPFSKADYIMDFNDIPSEWNDKWDVLFSNSLDHAIDATDIFYRWLDIVKTGGILVIGFDKNDDIGEADCCTFNSETVDGFMKSGNDKFEFVDCFDNSYVYYVLRKK